MALQEQRLGMQGVINMFLNILISLLVVIGLAIAMLCRSLVHTLLHHYKSFDEKYDAKDEWWNPVISWKNKYFIKWTIDLFNWRVTKFNIPVQVSDAFHWFNTLELGAFCFIISILFGFWYGTILSGIIAFAITGTLMVLIFNYGYDKFWR